MSVMREISAADREQNEQDEATVIAKTEVYAPNLFLPVYALNTNHKNSSFYRIVQGMKCKRSSCDGKPALRPLSEVGRPFSYPATRY